MGRKPYLMPLGGSSEVGLWGYIEAFRELQDQVISTWCRSHDTSYKIYQGVCENFDDLIFATGSGGTAAGMAIGNYLTGSKLR